ncbi:SET domain-containing protein [Trametes versicolor FP-101664 SS1]|uniref:SET domain-containing protein n=1 Tax=Trametes versicolor (strain FP-101664) TaxID=717944 RepID=UPI00046226FC|nr:SET domain-containing protein [Trametes versicolor FP-101664 SS1]EIW57463.1 SET domain-containing protein [Trametes versicolor FP-101664 SS1]
MASQFLRWLQENKIVLHQDIAIVHTPDAGIAVTSTSDCGILHPQTVASIPKSAILSVRTCALAGQIHGAPYGHGAALTLSLALYSEILKGVASRWHPYLQSLPATPVPIARLWGDACAFPDDPDSQEARLWIQGTEVQREIQDNDGSSLMDETRDYYTTEVHPLLESVKLQPTLQGFLHAYSLVCSRAFLVDAYHGLSMVPVADAFNHAHENHVQLASDFDVCPLCGSLTECPHDREDTSTRPPVPNRPLHASSDPSDTVDMVTVREIPPGTEVFNTYGADLGNAALLSRYGFALSGGDTDFVTFGWPGSGIVPEHDNEVEMFRAIYTQVHEDVEAAIVGRSAMVFAPDWAGQETWHEAVNSDGQASLWLFLWAVWIGLTERPPLALAGKSDIEILAALPQYLLPIVAALIQTEALRDDDTSAMRDLDAEPSDDVQLLAVAAEALASLCRTRISGMGKKGYRGARPDVLGDILDKLPPERTKTRLALEYLLAERALLETCAASWEDLRNIITNGSEVDEGSDMEP